METLKIALASDWFYPKIGGIETHIQELAYNLLKLGHEPHVITHDYRKFPFSFEDGFPFPVHRLRGEIYNSKEHVSMGISLIYQANKLYKKEKFDITHVHSIYSPLGIIIANLSKGIRDVPTVATNHSFFEWRLRREIWLPLLRYALKRIDAIIAVSRAVARDTEKIVRKNKKPVYIIPNAVDVSFWRPPDHEERIKARKMIGAEPIDFVVFAPGRFTQRKRIHEVPRIVANASRLLSEQRRRLYLVITGDGPLANRVKNEAQRYAGLVKVHLNGFVDRKVMRHYYWAADLTIVPSRLEAFSITALESMACGVPVIGYRGGGIEDLILDSVTGFLVKDDVEAAEKIALLATNDNLHAAMRDRAPYHVAKNFSWDKVIYWILDVYKSVIDSASPGERLFLLYRAWLGLTRLWRG